MLHLWVGLNFFLPSFHKTKLQILNLPTKFLLDVHRVQEQYWQWIDTFTRWSFGIIIFMETCGWCFVLEFKQNPFNRKLCSCIFCSNKQWIKKYLPPTCNYFRPFAHYTNIIKFNSGIQTDGNYRRKRRSPSPWMPKPWTSQVLQLRQ